MSLPPCRHILAHLFSPCIGSTLSVPLRSAWIAWRFSSRCAPAATTPRSCLRIASDRPAGAIDGICVELDAGGGQRFGRRYDLPSLPLPQTLTRAAGRQVGGADDRLWAEARHRGRARPRRSCRSGREASYMSMCRSTPASRARRADASSAIAAPTADAFEALALVPGANAAASGDIAVTAATGIVVALLRRRGGRGRAGRRRARCAGGSRARSSSSPISTATAGATS